MHARQEIYHYIPALFFTFYFETKTHQVVRVDPSIHSIAQGGLELEFGKEKIAFGISLPQLPK